MVSAETISKEAETLLTWNSNSIRRWEIPSGRELPALAGHTGIVKGALLLHSGSVLSWAYKESKYDFKNNCNVDIGSDEILVWNLLAGTKEKAITGKVSGHNLENTVEARYCVFPNGNAVIEEENTLVLFDVLNGHSVATLPGYRLMDWSNDRVITAKTPMSGDIEVYVSDSKTGNLLVTLREISYPDVRIKHLVNNNILAWSEELKLWQLFAEAGELLTSGKKGIDTALPIQNSHGQVLICSGKAAPIVLGSVGKKVATLSADDGNSGILKALSMQDGSVITMSRDYRLHYWQPEANPKKEPGFKSGFRLNVPKAKTIQNVAISPQGKILALCDYTFMHIWESPFAEPVVIENSKQCNSFGSCFLSENHLLANTAPPSIWDITGKPASTLGVESSVNGYLVI